MSVEEFITQENIVLGKSLESFRSEVQAFNMIAVGPKDVSKSISEKQVVDGDSTYVMLTIWQVIYSYLRLSFVTTLRGHTQESFALLRPGIEMVSHLYNMGLSPKENTMIWLRQNESGHKKRYKKIFEDNKFPKGNAAIERLGKIYRDCCDIGAHAGWRQLGRRGKTVVQDGKKIHYFYDLNVDSINTCQQLLYILHSAKYCLLIFRDVFEKTLSQKGFQPLKVAVKFAVDEIEKIVELRKSEGLFKREKSV